MRHGVIEVELESIREPAPDAYRETVEIRFPRIHPHRIRAALLGEKGVASRRAQALARNIFARDAVRRVKAIEETASENAVHAVEVVRGGASRKVRVLVARPYIFDER